MQTTTQAHPDSPRDQTPGQADVSFLAAPPQRTGSSHAPYFRLIPSDGWLTVLLTVIVIYLTIASIQAVTPAWAPGLEILTPVMALGILLGYVATQQRLLPDVLVHALVTVIGVAFAFYQTAGTVEGGNKLSLLNHTVTWFRLAVNPNANSSDNRVFLLFLATLTFLLSYVSYWLVFRTRRPWLMALANGVVLLINLNWTTSDQYFFLVLYLLAVMLLMVRFTLAENTRHWRAIGLRFSPDLGWDFMQAGVFFAVVVVLLPNLLPLGPASASLERSLSAANNPWQQAQIRLQAIFGGAGGKGAGGAGFFSTNLNLVNNFDPTNTQIMHYQTTLGTKSNPQTDPSQYLITQAYDTYDGQHAWSPAPATTQRAYDTDAVLPQSSRSSSYRYDTYTITLDTAATLANGGGSNVFAPGGEGAIFSIPTHVEFSIVSGVPSSPIAWASQSVLGANSSYQATGYVSTATAAELAQVPYPTQDPNTSDYPDNVLSEYLPGDTGYISGTVQQRAAQETKGAATMYQAAVDLENYLQTSFTYATHMPTPPNNQDDVAWFLNLKYGFCTWFASAMALMARSLGMPARIVSGYTAGTFDPRTNSYIVRDSQAHTWTQVYFGQYGWINFEPTASFSRFIRPQPITAAPSTTPSTVKGGATGVANRTPVGVRRNNPGGGSTQTSGQSGALIGVGLGLGALLILLALIAAAVVFWWRALYRTLSPIAAAFARVTLLGSWAGAPPRRSQTPGEYVERLGTLVPSQRGAFRRLSDLYARERWGGGLGAETSAEATGLYEQSRRSLTSVIARRARRAPLAALNGLRGLRLRGQRASRLDTVDDDEMANVN
ncbi:MAG TPA: transglutaminase domain-containing protein [Ktedonobacterales bacterium]|nr:transglutaminase domain-containing protein [Ktedonobacterales bacterium]